jgi:hypothetical protein
MPDPKKLKINDRIRFIDYPDEWNIPKYTVSRESKRFMKQMLRRKFSSRICKIDEYGHPWIAARFKVKGKIEHHSWRIVENTGWRKINRRKR